MKHFICLLLCFTLINFYTPKTVSAEEYNLGYSRVLTTTTGFYSDSAGKNLKGGLIGPGVHASHGMERTHIKGIYNTVDLIAAYLGL